MIGVEREDSRRISGSVRMRLGGGTLPFLHKVWDICAKDLRAELRGREVFSTMTSFSVLAVLIFGLAFDLRALAQAGQH